MRERFLKAKLLKSEKEKIAPRVKKRLEKMPVGRGRALSARRKGARGRPIGKKDLEGNGSRGGCHYTRTLEEASELEHRMTAPRGKNRGGSSTQPMDLSREKS